MQQNNDYDALSQLRTQVKQQIEKKYSSVEKFCFEEDFQKSTLSRLLSGKRSEFQIATLKKIANSLGKRLVIRIE